MTTITRSPDSRAGATSALRPTLAAAGLALLANLLVWAGARIAGADFSVESADRSEIMVGPLLVAVMTLAPVLLGGATLAAASRRSPRAWDLLAWIGLGIGFLTVAMPLTVEATAATQAALAAMHLATGLAWWLVVHRAGISRRRPRSAGTP